MELLRGEIGGKAGRKKLEGRSWKEEAGRKKLEGRSWKEEAGRKWGEGGKVEWYRSDTTYKRIFVG
jgi:hypothetical protein